MLKFEASLFFFVSLFVIMCIKNAAVLQNTDKQHTLLQHRWLLSQEYILLFPDILRFCHTIDCAPNGFQHIGHNHRGILMKRKWNVHFHSRMCAGNMFGTFHSKVFNVYITPNSRCELQKAGNHRNRLHIRQLVRTQQLCMNHHRTDVLLFSFKQSSSCCAAASPLQ